MFGFKFEHGMTDARQEGVVGRCVSWSPSLRAGRTLEESGAGGFQTPVRGRCHQGCHMVDTHRIHVWYIDLHLGNFWGKGKYSIHGSYGRYINTIHWGYVHQLPSREAGKHLPCRCPRRVDKAGHDWALPTPGGGFLHRLSQLIHWSITRKSRGKCHLGLIVKLLAV